MSAAWVQSQRGHIGIEAVAAICCRRRSTAWRLRLVDAASAAVLRLLRLEVLDAAARGAGSTAMSAPSSWAPPSWIPYLAMSLGMSLLTLQILVQVVRAES